MLRLLLHLYWKLSGWKVAGSFPLQYKKMVLIMAPHTSWKDVLVGFAGRNELKIYHAKFLGKKELFDGLFGSFFRWLGGIPVDRFSNQGMVEQAVAVFEKNDQFLLAMAPEGTRKRVDKLRSGFYHIAKTAGVPILPVGLDFENKKLIIGEIIFPGDDEAADFKRIIAFFSTVTGANPDYDLSHLRYVET
jgi:1-acyl-sn-glycerol-3-phosphate acyltransferase